MRPQGTIEVEVCTSSTTVVTLRCEHDLNTQPELAVALAVAGRSSDVAVDLTDASFIDSSVINVLLTAAAKLRPADGMLELILPPGAHPLGKLFRLMSIPALVPVHESREEALASLAARREQPSPVTGTRLKALVQLIEQPPTDGELWRKAA